MTYKTQGTCSRAIEIELDGNTVENVKFLGGCDGNTHGIASLVAGMDANEVIKRLEGIKCGFKKTSCPDQLACALRQELSQN
ncbi:MAG: TIGR03905 family TSCPD domain-containing protein [Clostridia bacterium]|nr:TIGR03905 family TSCPD domain-containing protein [Clostridia bacterium]